MWPASSSDVTSFKFHINGSPTNAGNNETVNNGNGIHVNISSTQVLSINANDYVEVYVTGPNRALQSGFSGFFIG
jgi:hypothetical protein